MTDIIPIFSSHYSLSKSILTLTPSEEDFRDGGPISIFSIAKHHGLSQIFLADDNLCGYYEAYANAEKEKVQLIFGLNIKVCSNCSVEEIDSDSTVTIWMRNSEGYEDLLRINEYANYNGYNEKKEAAFIDWENLSRLMTKNLGLTIPFYSSFLSENLFKYGKNAVPVFNNYNPILLVNSQGLPWDEELGAIVHKYGVDNNLKTLRAHNIYYYENKDVESLQIARCIDNRSSYEKPELPHFCSDEFSFQAYHKAANGNYQNSFAGLFTQYKIDKLSNGVRLPEINISKEEKASVGLSEDATNFDYLCSLTKAGLRKKILSNPKLIEKKFEYIARCKEELDTFKRLHLVDYILLVQDLLSWAVRNDIPVGPARGSSAGSLVAYLVDIVHIDPMKYNLYFSRFISEARAQSKEIDGVIYLNGSTMPDVDSDISYKQRYKVIDYINNKYKGKTAKIGTTTTLTGKLLIKEVSKIYLNYSEADAQHLADMVEKIFGVVVDLDKAYEENKQFKQWVNENANNKKCYDLARSLENLIKNRGQHASGVAISYHEINSLVPIIRSADGKSFVTAYDMQNVANLLVKVDILGLKTLDVIYETCDMVGIEYGNIDIDEESIYNFLNQNTNFQGLFQIEKGLGKNTVLNIKPKNIHDYAACVAIGRPGAMKYIPEYAAFQETGEYVKLYDPIDKYLKRTGGIIIYQEQINEICQNVYQMSGKDADMVRYAIGKKKREEMDKWEPVVRQQGEKLGIPVEVTEKFWATCNASADYMFNQSHSYAYAMLSAMTTFLKANHSQQFFTSCLRMAKHEPDPMLEIATIQRELAFFGIQLLPPSVKESGSDFEMEMANIRYGLGAIKGIAEASQERLLSFNRKYSNKFELFNNCQMAKLGLGVVSSLINAGCFPDYGVSRARLLLEYQTFNLLKEKEKTALTKYAEKFNEDLFATLKHLQLVSNEKGKPLLTESRLETIKKDYQNYKKIFDFNKSHGKILSFLEERSVLGYSFSTSLSDIYQAEYPEIISLYEASTDLDESLNTFIGIVAGVKEGKSRAKKTPYIALELEDGQGQVKAMAFNKSIDFFKDEKKKAVEEGTIVICRGRKKDGATYFVEWGKVLWDIKLAKRINQVNGKGKEE